jgi:hypothetical protein
VGGVYVLYSNWGVDCVYGIMLVIIRWGDGSFVAWLYTSQCLFAGSSTLLSTVTAYARGLPICQGTLNQVPFFQLACSQFPLNEHPHKFWVVYEDIITAHPLAQQLVQESRFTLYHYASTDAHRSVFRPIDWVESFGSETEAGWCGWTTQLKDF